MEEANNMNAAIETKYVVQINIGGWEDLCDCATLEEAYEQIESYEQDDRTDGETNQYKVVIR